MLLLRIQTPIWQPLQSNYLPKNRWQSPTIPNQHWWHQRNVESHQSNQGIHHLGVHISMDGNQKAKTQMLFKCCWLLQRVYLKCPMTHHEAEVLYSTIFLPTITYPFSATTLSLQIRMSPELWPQSSLVIWGIMAICQRPLCMYQIFGSLRLQHLHTKQELQQTQPLGNSSPPTSKLTKISNEIQQPVLEGTQPLP